MFLGVDDVEGPEIHKRFCCIMSVMVLVNLDMTVAKVLILITVGILESRVATGGLRVIATATGEGLYVVCGVVLPPNKMCHAAS